MGDPCYLFIMKASPSLKRWGVWMVALLLAASLLPAGRARAAPLDNRDITDDVLYLYMPIAWRDSSGDANRFGDFDGMTGALPYLRYLGVTGVWMTPIFPSPAYHGYQHGPVNQLNPSFGTEAQFLNYLGTAHSDSIKVFIDLVAYQISQNSIYFTDSYHNNSSIYTEWLSYYNAHSGNSNFLGGNYNSWNGANVGSINWNLNNSLASNTVINWCKHWLDPNGDANPADGVDGYRLDHVSVNDPTEGAWGYNIAWWQTWKSAMLSVNLSMISFAEQADWGSHGNDLLTAHDAAFTKPFEFAARGAIASENAGQLYSEMAATLASLPAGKTYLCTLSDHDVDRLMSSIGSVQGRAKVAAAIQMTQPFTPVVYFGDELGMRGTKQNYGSDANDIPFREPFKWKAVSGPPMSNYFILNSQAYNNRVERDNDGRSVEEEAGVAGSLLETYRSLISLRRGHRALRHGTYVAVSNTSPAVWSFLRFNSGAESLLVAINLSGSAVSIAANLSAGVVTSGSSPVRDLVSGAAWPSLTSANQSAYPISLGPYSYVVLNMGFTPRPALTDGRNILVDSGVGARVALQNNATGLGDNVNELDAMLVRPDVNGLEVGITGNLGTDGTALALFLDTSAGGQGTLNLPGFPEPPSGLPELTGMVFDASFAPDRVLFVNAFGGNLYVDLYSLASGGGGSKRYMGAGAVNSLAGGLYGGDNPNGLLVALCDSNTSGVTASSVANAAAATMGFEMELPWADLGMGGAGADVKLMAMIVRADGFAGNQFLPGLGGGRANLGYAPFDLNSIPGTQYLTVSTSLATGVPEAHPSARRLRASPSPFTGSTTLRFENLGPGASRIDIFDISGRRVRSFGPGEPGRTGSWVWDGRSETGQTSPPGIYFFRLRAGGEELTARAVRLGGAAGGP